MHGLKYGTKKHTWKYSHNSHSGLLYWIEEVSSASHSLATSVPLDLGLVSSNPALSLSKHWLEMTLQSIVRHSWVCSNQQSTTTKIKHGKINARTLPAFLQMSYRLQLVSLYRTTACNIEDLTLTDCQLLSKGRSMPLSLRADEGDAHRDEECHPQKDKKDKSSRP